MSPVRSCRRGHGMAASVQVFGRRDDEAIHAARRAGVRKAPRQEIAGGGAPAVPRTLWGFSRGLGLRRLDRSGCGDRFSAKPGRVRWGEQAICALHDRIGRCDCGAIGRIDASLGAAG